jgi:hypothetical protein
MAAISTIWATTFAMQPPHCGRAPQARKTTPGVTTVKTSRSATRRTALPMSAEDSALH